MNKPDSSHLAKFLRGACLLLLIALVLSSCAAEPKHKHRLNRAHSKAVITEKTPEPPAQTAEAPTPPTYQADDFIASLTLARLAGASAPLYLQTLDGYAADAHASKARLPVVVLEYKLRRKRDMHEALVPVIVAREGTDFTGLQEIMGKLSSLRYTLYNIRIQTVIVSPGPLLKNMEPAARRAELERQQEQMLASGEKFSAREEAALEMDLTRAFMHLRVRDGAYLALENAKQALAADAQSNAAENPELAKALEALEAELHRTMPFGLTIP